MVYGGKPSRGCRMCKIRRIKCDETKPTCNQCAKLRQQCPGYKDDFDLMLRDETKATERRAQKAGGKARAQKRPVGGPGSSLSSSSSSSSDETWRTPTSLAGREGGSIAPAIMVPLDQKATCFFVSNFVLLPRESGLRGNMDYLVPLLQQEVVADCLKHAFSACSLAVMGNRVSSNSISFGEQALSEYTKAISGVHAALRDADAAKQDSTLASILLLAFFENISSKEVGTVAWGPHIEGAVQLVKMRGKEQLETKTGMMLFVAVRSIMMVHALMSGKGSIQGTDWWMVEPVVNQPAVECPRLNIKVAELRHETHRIMTSLSRTPEAIEQMWTLIRLGQTYDRECGAWMDNVPENWRFRTVAWEDNVPGGDYSKAEVFPGRVDIYPDPWTANMWNLVRTTRILLASIIVRCAAWVCAPVDYRTTPEYATSSRTATETITDVIASVPFSLGWHRRRPDIMAGQGLTGFACGDDHALKGLAGFYLTWPLGCLNTQDYLSDAQRAWVFGRLRFIGEELGVRYALSLRQINVRIPSMLIRRDGLMATPYPAAHNFEKLLSEKRIPPPPPPAAPRPSVRPIRQKETMKEHGQRRQAEFVRQAGVTAIEQEPLVA